MIELHVSVYICNNITTSSFREGYERADMF